jgi:hypothetical protein
MNHENGFGFLYAMPSAICDVLINTKLPKKKIKEWMNIIAMGSHLHLS